MVCNIYFYPRRPKNDRYTLKKLRMSSLHETRHIKTKHNITTSSAWFLSDLGKWQRKGRPHYIDSTSSPRSWPIARRLMVVLLSVPNCLTTMRHWNRDEVYCQHSTSSGVKLIRKVDGHVKNEYIIYLYGYRWYPQLNEIIVKRRGKTLCKL